MSNYRRKLIEVDLPLDDINRESAREKSIRHGHPSTLHLWWARRPLAACRAVIFASLVDDPSSCPEEFPTAEAQLAERDRLHEIIKRLVVWENSSDEGTLAEARREIARSVARSRGETAPAEPDRVLAYLADKALPVYDPFCGGGSIPLEVQRLGLKAVGSDLNPVAVLITKALIELPPRFAGKPPVNPDADRMGMTVGKGRKKQQVPWRGAAGLADDIRYYGRWMRERAAERIGHLYPQATDENGNPLTVIAWLWARTVPCPNPACGIAMPLMRTFQVSKKRGNEHWTRPVVGKGRGVSFVVQDHDRGVPADGTVNRNGATCVACGSVSPLSYVREQSRAGRMGEQMTAIVAEGDRRRVFLSPTEEHVRIALSVKPEWRPIGRLPEKALGFSIQGYGFTEWHQFFTLRQLLTQTTFSDLLNETSATMISDGVNFDYMNTIATYLALAIGKNADSNCRFARWQNSGDFVAGIFDMQTISIVWDFAEPNPFSSSTQNWMAQIEWIARVVERSPVRVNVSEAHQADASTTIHAEYGPVIVTDPPYYKNIGYADLSDFFYVWLRPLLRDAYPYMFAGILTPKDEEMIAAPRFEDSHQRFESLLHSTLTLIQERCTDESPSSIFYAYKQQEEEHEGKVSTGWETMLGALVDAGFRIIGTWPMRTERPGRSRQISSNALASSIVLVCRPRPDDAPVATRREFLGALEREMPAALDHLTRESHIAPTDLAQAAIGPGMEIYSRYRRVETISGEPVTVRDALAAINAAIADYDRAASGELDPASRFCLGWLRQHGYGEGSYGEADTMARAYDVSVDALRDADRLLHAEGGRVKLLGLDEYASDRPRPRGDMTAWEAAMRMAWHVQLGEGRDGAAGAAVVGRAMGSGVESVERPGTVSRRRCRRRSRPSSSSEEIRSE